MDSEELGMGLLPQPTEISVHVSQQQMLLSSHPLLHVDTSWQVDHAETGRYPM